MKIASIRNYFVKSTREQFPGIIAAAIQAPKMLQPTQINFTVVKR